MPLPVSTFGVGSGTRTVAGLQVVRHEDEVVDLHDPVAVARPAVRVATGVGLAAVVEDLGALPARPRLAGLPEVVLPEPDDALGRNADALPRLDRDGVLLQFEQRVPFVDGRPEALRLEPEHLGDPVPREVDGLVLVVVAEREVAHHLEEGAVPFRAADLVEVVVLPAGAQAGLNAHHARARGLFGAKEVGLERLHPGDDEEGRLVLRRRHQRVPGHAQMPALLVEALKRLAQFVRRHRHGRTVYGRPTDALWNVCHTSVHFGLTTGLVSRRPGPIDRRFRSGGAFGVGTVRTPDGRLWNVCHTSVTSFGDGTGLAATWPDRSTLSIRRRVRGRTRPPRSRS